MNKVLRIKHDNSLKYSKGDTVSANFIIEEIDYKNVTLSLLEIEDSSASKLLFYVPNICIFGEYTVEDEIDVNVDMISFCGKERPIMWVSPKDVVIDVDGIQVTLKKKDAIALASIRKGEHRDKTS